MTLGPRDPAGAAGERYDLIVVGGGILGACVALEASRSGRRTLLLERDDFGGATSWNSLRILHGGLRYLQSLDLPRFFESIGERRFFLQHFPELTAPLPCLLPLRGKGLKRPSTFGVALKLNDVLSWRRNDDVPERCHLPGSHLVSRDDTLRRVPLLPAEKLQGAGLWHDGLLLSSERLLIEVLRWAVAEGAVVLNRMEARSLVVEEGRVTGLEAEDGTIGSSHRYSAPVVVNCAGPWCRELATRLDRDHAELFQRQLAFNLILDVEPPSSEALAVEPPRLGAPMMFLVPWKGRLHAGTRHLSWNEGDDRQPGEEALQLFLDDLTGALPGLPANRDKVLRVHWGELPARAPGSDEMAKRPALVDHSQAGGPSGLHSLSGIKYTTARHVAERFLERCPPASGPRPDARTRPVVRTGLTDVSLRLTSLQDRADFSKELRVLSEEEMAPHLDDLLLRRIEGLHQHGDLNAAADLACEALDHDDARRQEERQRLAAAVRSRSLDGLLSTAPAATVAS